MYLNFKYTFDKIFGVLALIILSPILAIISIAIAFDGKGNVILKQSRIGQFKKPFNVYKFRTMKLTDVEFDIDFPIVYDDNPNLTFIGAILRKIKFDELPQLLNVIKGEMSIIGARPLLPIYMKYYEPWELEKFKVRPGLSGLAQVRGNSHLSIAERSCYDIIYGNNISLKLDIQIISKTILVIFLGEKRFTKHISEEFMLKMKCGTVLDETESKKVNNVIEIKNKSSEGDIITKNSARNDENMQTYSKKGTKHGKQ